MTTGSPDGEGAATVFKGQNTVYYQYYLLAFCAGEVRLPIPDSVRVEQPGNSDELAVEYSLGGIGRRSAGGLKWNLVECVLTALMVCSYSFLRPSDSLNRILREPCK